MLAQKIIFISLGLLIVNLFAQNYFPHTINSKWVYSDSLTVEITETTTLNNGVEVYKFMAVKTFENITDTFYYYQNISDDQIKQYYSIDGSYAITLLKGPYVVGTFWLDIDSEGKVLDTLQIISLNESVTTIAGTFLNCLKIKCYHVGNTAYLWYAPNVGFVKIESQVECEDSCSDKELVSYTINQ